MMQTLLTRLAFRRGRSERREAAPRLLPGRLSDDPVDAARALLDGRLLDPGFDDVLLVDGRVPWGEVVSLSRSHRRQLHGHAVLRDLSHAYRGAGDREWLDAGSALVADWVAGFPIDDRAGAGDPMAWHDETTAMRVQSWLLLRQELQQADHPALPDLEGPLRDHASLLADDGFHTTGTNHGMFQDEALLTYACLVPEDPESARYFELATERLAAYFDAIITDDGVHREHAPAYHNLIASKVRRLARFYADAGRGGTASALEALHASMARYATHAVTPAGEFPLVSDTHERNRARLHIFDDPAYRWAVTTGRRGERPTETAVVFAEADYAIFRDEWRQDGLGTYLHFTAAYHTDYHKHSDDLSVWLYHDGDLLTEAGPNGYDYADPYTAYGYSSHAHNTLVVDGESLPRVDDRSDRVGLVAWDTGTPRPWARGRNARWDDVVHEREVRFDPDAAVVTVLDEVTTTGEHEYELLWNCAPGVEPVLVGQDTVRLERDGQDVGSVTVAATVPFTLTRIRGDIERMRGFRLGGGEPEPTWVVGIATASPARVPATRGDGSVVEVTQRIELLRPEP